MFQWVTKFWRAETAIFLAAWLLLMTSGRSQLFKDPGTFWHVVVGQRILCTGELIYTDPFSFTMAGKPWIAQQWLGECALALIHRVGGMDSILLATVTFLAGLFTWVSHRMIRVGIDPVLASFFTALAFLASAFHFHPRPHLLTIGLLAWTFSRLCDFEAGRLSLPRLFWLVPVYVIWTNVHGGMVTGVATLALAVLGWGVANVIGKESPLVSYRQMIALGALVLTCGLTALVNPYGTRLLHVWFGLIGSPVLPKLIGEHAPLLTGSGGWTVLLFALFYLIALLGVLPKWPRVTWLIPLFWLYAAWTRARNGPLFSITAAIALAEMFPHIRWAAWLGKHGSRAFRLRPAKLATSGQRFFWRPALLPAALALTALVLQMAGVPAPVLGSGWAKLDPTYWPVELLPELRAYERNRPNGTPIFNEMLHGGFLIYYTPGLRVFIDDRCELYGDEQLLAYAHALFDDPGQVERWQQQYGFTAALTVTGSGFDRYLQSAKGWTVVRQTKTATFYRRTGS